MLEDRKDAATRLAEPLRPYRSAPRALIVAVPRGGVELGYHLARALDLDLEVVLAKKIGHPYQPEYAIGAVSPRQWRVNQRAALHVSPWWLRETVERLQSRLRAQDALYHQGAPSLSFRGRTLILVDDGIATGRTLGLAIELLRDEQPRRILVALPVGPPEAVKELEALADEVICLEQPQYFVAIGSHYRHFPQVSDRECTRFLALGRERREMQRET